MTREDWAQAKELIAILEEANQVLFYFSHIRKYLTVHCNILYFLKYPVPSNKPHTQFFKK
jgi:hypothetical protein